MGGWECSPTILASCNEKLDQGRDQEQLRDVPGDGHLGQVLGNEGHHQILGDEQLVQVLGNESWSWRLSRVPGNKIELL